MNKRTLLVFLLCLAGLMPAFSQTEKKGEVYTYARVIVDSMASEHMHGRGYVNGGDSIAAYFLRSEFKKLGLRSFAEDHYQRFSFPINTFPGELQLRFTIIDDNDKYSEFRGKPGENFITDASSPSIYTDCLLKVFDSTCAVSEKTFKKFTRRLKPVDMILIDDRGLKDKEKIEYFKRIRTEKTKAKGTIDIKQKLTWSQSQVVSDYIRFQVLGDSIPWVGCVAPKGGGGFKIENKFLKDHKTQNVIGYVPGSEFPDSFIVFSAHYDHLGHMGADTYFPGANDNASGCAMLLNLAKHYSRPENRPKFSVVFIAFAGEEVGLLGSKYYTENPLFPLSQVRFLLNMDIMGTGEDGITVVNGSVFTKQFDLLKKINTENNFIKDVKVRGKAANSDHYYFSEKGVPAFFIYTMGGIKAYHDIYDRPETLPLNEFEDLFRMITLFADGL